MATHENEHGKSSDDSETADETSVGNNDKKNTGRRIQDGIISKDPGRKLNLDRRTPHSDRRVDTDPHYNGPPRRNIIDRRLNLKDRRRKE